MLKHSFLAVAALALLAACAGDGSSKNPAMKAQGSWKEIGKINEGNIDVSYDTGSLKRQGNTATLTDRKYVHKPSKESYRNTPEYKYAISQWMFQCMLVLTALRKPSFLMTKANRSPNINIPPAKRATKPLCPTPPPPAC